MLGAVQGDVTELLARMETGDPDVAERLAMLVHDELRALAASYLARERPDHTLQPTALVNEAWMRLAGQDHARWESKGHFMAIAATAMRRVLVNHAVSRKRLKRGGGASRRVLDDDVTATSMHAGDLLALDEALAKFASIDPRKVRIVELRFFAGLSVEQTARVLDVSPETVKRDWRLAKLWLLRELSEDPDAGSEPT